MWKLYKYAQNKKWLFKWKLDAITTQDYHKLYQMIKVEVLYDWNIKVYYNIQKFKKSIDKINDDINLLTANYIHNTNWMYINKSAYNKIMEWKPEDIYIDYFIGDKTKLKNLFIFPFLGMQESGNLLLRTRCRAEPFLDSSHQSNLS